MILVFGLVFVFGANSVSAANQDPNLDVYLGSYSAIAPGTVYSGYCKAKLTSLTLRLQVASGTTDYEVQYRGPNEAWKNLAGYKGLSRGTKNINLNVKKDYDYRLKMKAYLVTTSGTVMCV